MAFCDEIKLRRTAGNKNDKMGNTKKSDRIMFTRGWFQDSPGKLKPIAKGSLSQPKPSKPFMKQDIAYRRNFREINNFEWGKLDRESFDPTNLLPK